MIEILQFYTSGFWVWLGITVGLSIVVEETAKLLIALLRGCK